MTLARTIARLAAARYNDPIDRADDLDAVAAALAPILPRSAAKWVAAAETYAQAIRDACSAEDDGSDPHALSAVNGIATPPDTAELAERWAAALDRAATIGTLHGETVDREDTPDDHAGWAAHCWGQMVDGSSGDAQAGDWPDDPALRDAYVTAFVAAREAQ